MADGRHADQPIGKQVLENMLEGSSQFGFELVLLLPVPQVAVITSVLPHPSWGSFFFQSWKHLSIHGILDSCMI